MVPSTFPAAGARIGQRYILRRVLGRGGMGQVLEVEHEELGRRFALKVLPPIGSGDGSQRRFRREIQALARIRSPRVAQITDCGEDPNYGPFYVMELLEGETLEARYRREGKLAPHVALAIAAEVAQGLAVVHEAGLLHRDVKPSNVGLCSDRDVPVKLLDFGLAIESSAREMSQITNSLQVVGSVPYLAPERLEDSPASPQSDLWSLGVTLYQSLTGTMPFEADSAAGLLHRILNEPPRAIDDASIDGVAGDVLARLLAKRPEDRFETAREAAIALREAAEAAKLDVHDSEATTRPFPRVRRPLTRRASRMWRAGAAATLLVGSAMIGLAVAFTPGTFGMAAAAPQPMPVPQQVAPANVEHVDREPAMPTSIVVPTAPVPIEPAPSEKARPVVRRVRPRPAATAIEPAPSATPAPMPRAEGEARPTEPPRWSGEIIEID